MRSSRRCSFLCRPPRRCRRGLPRDYERWTSSWRSKLGDWRPWRRPLVGQSGPICSRDCASLSSAWRIQRTSCGDCCSRLLRISLRSPPCGCRTMIRGTTQPNSAAAVPQGSAAAARMPAVRAVLLTRPPTGRCRATSPPTRSGQRPTSTSTPPPWLVCEYGPRARSSASRRPWNASRPWSFHLSRHFEARWQTSVTRIGSSRPQPSS
mmetsp:Transcript_16488/g.36134  ORF Transcript_16488/g.36134 Transcript_16488/m.36134 type:complete len:208 (+) Transcript_16488:163-786(+)